MPRAWSLEFEIPEGLQLLDFDPDSAIFDRGDQVAGKWAILLWANRGS